MTRPETEHVPGALIVTWRGQVRRWNPKDGREVTFGRDGDQVHVCVTDDDLGVSRVHGTLTCHDAVWSVRTTGRRPVQVGEARFVSNQDEPWALPAGYSSLLVHGDGRVHLVEVLVAGPDGWRRTGWSDHATAPLPGYGLDGRERLAVVAIAEDYLRGDPAARPRSWRAAATVLAEIDPAGRWTYKSVERVVRALRLRLVAENPNLDMISDGRDAGDLLKRNLVRALLVSSTITGRDLDLIDLDAH